MPKIHPTAIVDPRATLAEDVSVGPYTIIEGAVEIGPRTVIHAHCVLKGPTRIGSDNQIGPAAYVGGDPQHLLHDQSLETWLVIGDHNIIREAASLHRATKPGIENATRVGNNCLFMSCSHVAHDAVVGNRAIFANGALTAGHVQIGDGVFLSGGVGIHQFVRIGRLAIVGGNEITTADIPPFAAARYGALKGYNAIGCKRAGIPKPSLFAIRKVYHCFHNNRMMPAVIQAIKDTCPPVPEVQEFLDFVATSKRGIHRSVRFLHVGTGEKDAGDAD